MKQITWEDVDDFIDSVAIKYAGHQPTGVYGIPRGGTVLAVMLSHTLGVPYLGSPCEGCMVVDDISDSGTTLQHYREKGYEIVTMFCHPNTSVTPNFYGMIKGEEWLVFPWERTFP